MKWAVRGIAAAIVLAAIGVAVWKLRPPAQRSAIITEPWAELQGKPWLKPDLRDAEVFLPDRPHTRVEAEHARTGRIRFDRVRSYRLSTNSQRLRGPESGPKAGGTPRIVAIGDSVTHGWGVSYEEAYPAQLAAELARRGTAAEVVNAGVPANRVDVMAAWCAGPGKALQPDLVLWTRRVPGDPNGLDVYAQAVEQCASATRVPVIVVLPPVSQFDLHGSRVYRSEQQGLQQRLAPRGIPVVELTDVFREAQKGRGETLERTGDTLRVVDQESGKVWLEAKATPQDLPAEIYALFERESAVREALMFDEGHPDAEGFALFARAVADRVAERLPR